MIKIYAVAMDPDEEWEWDGECDCPICMKAGDGEPVQHRNEFRTRWAVGEFLRIHFGIPAPLELFADELRDKWGLAIR